MIAQLQLNHSLSAYNGIALQDLNLGVEVRLYSPIAAFEEIYLKASSVRIVARSAGEQGYINISIPTSVIDAEGITSRAAGNIELKLFSRASDGVDYTVQIFDASISDFRSDIALGGATYTLVLRDDFSTPVKSAIVITDYVSKKKMAYTGALEYYICQQV